MTDTGNKEKAPQSIILYFLLFVSGAAGLGYELSWTRLFAAGFGSEITAVLAVVAAFFIGLAAGAWIFDGSVRKSAAPAQWYAVCELITGCWALLLICFIPQVNTWAALLTGVEPSPVRQWMVSFGVPLLILLPATAAMGATLPAMEQLLWHLRSRNRSVAGLYAANTLGAFSGVAATFMLIPLLGYRISQTVFIVLNFICAAGMLIYAGYTPIQKPAPVQNVAVAMPSGRLLLTLFITGLLGIGYEVVLIRVMSQILENTVYSFASALCIYLLGTAVGAAVYQKFASRLDFERTLAVLLYGASAACLGGIITLPYAEKIYSAARMAFGSGFTGALCGEFVLAGAVFIGPTLAMGALFSHLMQKACVVMQSAGRALAVNTVGAALSPFVFGVAAISIFGTKNAMLTAAIGYMLLVPFRNLVRSPAGIIALVLAVTAAFVASDFYLLKLPPDFRITDHREGVMASVTVVEDAGGDRFLKVNNKFQMGGTASQVADQRQAHIPLLLHPNPKHALFLGLGTGATFAAAADHPGLAAEGIEIIPEVIDVLPYFKKATGDLSTKQGLRIIAADARRYVCACPEKSYDVIVADLFHPARDGAGLLYSAEHFESIRRLLAPGGLFCQWLPLYQLDADTLRLIVRTFLRVFPTGSAYLGTFSIDMPMLGLMGGVDQQPYAAGWMESRVHSSSLAGKLKTIRLAGFYDLFGCYAAGPSDLARYAGSGPLNTDDRPLVIFNAPRFAYSEVHAPHELLRDMFDHFAPDPSCVIGGAQNDAHGEALQRLAAYWKARNLFIETGIAVKPGSDMRRLLSAIKKPLLACVHISADFSPAYEPLLAMAQKIAGIDRTGACELLAELEQANPHRKEAALLRRQLSGG